MAYPTTSPPGSAYPSIASENEQIIRQLDKVGLTTRELQVAELIHCGISTNNISERLNLRYRTVRNHIKYIYCKMGVSTWSEMLTWSG